MYQLTNTDGETITVNNFEYADVQHCKLWCWVYRVVTDIYGVHHYVNTMEQ